MRRRAVSIAILAMLGGCIASRPPAAKPAADAGLFTAESMHLSPVFTKVADFDGDNKPDGIEAVVELQDRFGDPVKAVGRLVFQVYQFAPYNPEPRGPRVAGPYEGRVDSVADQRARWSRVNQSYIFQLDVPLAQADKDYVLEAMFETADGRRLFDRLTIEGDHTRPTTTTGPAPLTGPTTSGSGPGTGPAGVDATRPGAITTQESSRAVSQPHEPPPRADQP